MKAVVIAALLLVSAAPFVDAAPKWHQLEGYTFDQYKADFGKQYSASEETTRRAAFEARMAEIKAHNTRSPAPSWRMGVNKMTDMSDVEFKASLGVTRHSNSGHLYASGSVKSTAREYVPSGKAIPASVDWRNKGVLTAVKDQGHCGSCWAHAAAEAIESQMALKTGQLFVLSQQQLTSCVPNPNHCGGTGGCDGATAELAYDYLSTTSGITEEWMYPYTSYFGEVAACQANKTGVKPFVKVNGYTLTKRNDATALMDAIANYGPLSISIDASNWRDYESGIFTGCDYSKNITINHAVQVAGYGHDATLGMDYWLVRNSWSPIYGEAGYIRLFKEPTGTAPQCGWDNQWVTIGGGCNGESQDVWACGQCGILYDTVFPNVV